MEWNEIIRNKRVIFQVYQNNVNEEVEINALSRMLLIMKY